MYNKTFISNIINQQSYLIAKHMKTPNWDAQEKVGKFPVMHDIVHSCVEFLIKICCNLNQFTTSPFKENTYD